MKYVTSAMRHLIRILAMLVAISPAAVPQTSEVAQIERLDESTVLFGNTFRPLDAIATKLEALFGVAVSAEDPVFQFHFGGPWCDALARFDPSSLLGTSGARDARGFSFVS